MKRILILLLCLTLCLGGLTACGGDRRDDTVSPGGSVTDPGGSMADDPAENPSAPNASQPNGGSAAGDPSGNGSGSMPEGALNNGTVGENPAAGRNDGDNSDGGSASASHTRGRSARDDALFRPAGYRQMLRNARVHDSDGILTDGENSVTPGILH